MKKFFIILALAATVQVANGQQQAKSVNAAKSALDKAAAAVENPKSNTKLATWLKYGQALMDAYNAPAGNAWAGMTQQEFNVLSNGEKAQSQEQVTVSGQPYLKQVFANKNLYFGQDGKLVVIEITKPVVENGLEKALDAYKKAVTLDPKGTKTKDIAEALKNISSKYVDQAYNAYALGDFLKASEGFEKAFNAAATAPYSTVDTLSLYNAGFTAWHGLNFDRAKTFFSKCADYGYLGSDGDVYVKLADIAERAGDAAARKNYLEQGFVKYPQSQGILVGLINYYIVSGEDTDRLFKLIDDAKKNDPKNASLAYVEGNAYVKLNRFEEAEKAYDECATIDPTYEYGYIGKGIYLYNRAVALQEEASKELDDAKYTALQGQFESVLKACIEPFEKGFELCKDNGDKKTVAEYLKNACFRFRTQDPSYMEKYEKYSKVAQE